MWVIFIGQVTNAYKGTCFVRLTLVDFKLKVVYKIFLHIRNVFIPSALLFSLIFRKGHLMCLTDTANV